MVENLVNNIMLWQQGLDLKVEQQKSRVSSPNLEDALTPGPCRIEYKLFSPLSYTLEKDY